MPSIQLKTAVPGPKSREIFAARERQVSSGPFHITPVVAAQAEGSVITDVDGNQLLDFAAGIGVANLGHREPSVVAAIRGQLDRFIHTSINVVAYEGYVRVAERLNARMPGPGPAKTFLANSGAEAVENAVKFARAFTRRQGVIAFTHAYHGRTFMALALTSKAHPYKSGFAPFPAEVYRAEFPDFYRWPGVEEPPPACPGDAAACGLARCLCREAFAAFAEWVGNRQGDSEEITGDSAALFRWLAAPSAATDFQRIIGLMGRMEYKRRQTCPGTKVSKVAFGIGRRIPIVERWS